MTRTMRIGMVLAGAIYALALPVIAQTDTEANRTNDSHYFTAVPTSQAPAPLRIDDFFSPFDFTSLAYDAIRSPGPYWSEPGIYPTHELNLKYTWRKMKLEGSMSNRQARQDKSLQTGLVDLMKAVNSRLSYNLQSNWRVRLSRGRFNKPEQIDPQEEIKRTMISTTYQYAFENTDWQTTLAYAHGGRKFDGRRSNVHFFETLFRAHRVHTFFGRAERATADELFRDRETFDGPNFMGHRYTLGYVYDVKDAGPIKFAVGGLITKRLVPAEHLSTAGKDPTTFKLIARVSIRLP